MKKTDWTDRMLAALVELYPVETTAYTAAVLNLSESTVKLKARELGLVKTGQIQMDGACRLYQKPFPGVFLF